MKMSTRPSKTAMSKPPLPEPKVAISEPALIDRLKQILSEMPELQMTPTDRYYGEEYYPKMTKIIAQLRSLIE